LAVTDRSPAIIANRSNTMTLAHLVRTAVIALLGLAALAVASHARAEGGEGSSVLSPDQLQAVAHAAADEAAPQEPAVPARKPLKGKETARKTAKQTASASDAQAEKPAAEAASATDDQEETTAAEQAAAIPLLPFDTKLKSRQGDAVRAAALKPLIVRFATENGLPYSLADAVVRLESRYNPGARNGPHVGLTQINVQTAQSLGYQGAAAGLLDAETNLRYGLKYLAQAYRLAGGDTCGTILRYQFGHRTQTMTSASRAYCAKVKVIASALD
jgi:soluble lytic murein transglycosylase-like protein